MRFWLFCAALANDLNDATGNNAPVEAKNAPFQAGTSIFCNGRYLRDVGAAEIHPAHELRQCHRVLWEKARTVEEMGRWAVQYYLARWLAEQTDQSFFTSGTIRYTDRLVKEADNLLKQQFCNP